MEHDNVIRIAEIDHTCTRQNHTSIMSCSNGKVVYNGNEDGGRCAIGSNAD